MAGHLASTGTINRILSDISIKCPHAISVRNELAGEGDGAVISNRTEASVMIDFSDPFFWRELATEFGVQNNASLIPEIWAGIAAAMNFRGNESGFEVIKIYSWVNNNNGML
eukprot:SAG22_NODE_4951_length_1123_cov_88.268555_2_plen_112_part_00